MNNYNLRRMAFWILVIIIYSMILIPPYIIVVYNLNILWFALSLFLLIVLIQKFDVEWKIYKLLKYKIFANKNGNHIQ